MTQKLIINGGKKLEGQLPVFGAKNACLPIICATLLADEKVELTNIPNLSDINLLLELLEVAGATVQFDKKERKIIVNPNVTNGDVGEKANKMRASMLLLAPLLAKYGEVKIPFPGGCAIGGRPIDITIDGLRALGTEFVEDEQYIIAKSKGRLVGSKFKMHFPSVTGTENLVMAAVLAQGQTILENCAQEPEVLDLIDMLNTMGADISVVGSTITVNGVDKLLGGKHAIVPDRIITGTYSILAALCAGEKGIRITNCRPQDIAAELAVMQKAGVKFETGKDYIFVPQQNEDFTAVDFETDVYPGFATDLQSLMMLLLSQAQGQSHVTENIYENRFMHVAELNKMGANITAISNHIAIVRGKYKLRGVEVDSSDLRASATMVIAGLIAQGQTKVSKINHLDRGYETLDLFLSQIGADIERKEV